MNRRLAFALVGVFAALSGGCGPTFGPQAKNGITFYCPGAGNVDFGDQGVRTGLARAGYDGQVASLLWTVSLNPAIDQLLKQNARLGAARLARYIEAYIDRYPGCEVNVIGLSAGTGVAIWAVENLKPKYQVNQVVLLSSSLYYRYDVSKALRRIKGAIHVFHSPNDAILAGPMKVFGTIDGVFLQDGAGAVGLHPPSGAERVVNTAWQREFSRYGYHGGHLDSTSPDFIRTYVAPIITGRSALGPRGTGSATEPVTASRGEHPN